MERELSKESAFLKSFWIPFLFLNKYFKNLSRCDPLSRSLYILREAEVVWSVKLRRMLDDVNEISDIRGGWDLEWAETFVFTLT